MERAPSNAGLAWRQELVAPHRALVPLLLAVALEASLAPRGGLPVTMVPWRDGRAVPARWLEGLKRERAQ
eukprot:4371718-Heterocapsa_arctica.AAC.1